MRRFSHEVEDLFAKLEAQDDLTPARLEKEARPAESPLHADFQWDDAEAGYAHRLSQARALIRQYRIHVEVKQAEHVPHVLRLTPAYVAKRHVGSPSSVGYRAVQSVLASSEMTANFLLTAEEALRSYRRWFAVLVGKPEFEALWAKLQKEEAQLDKAAEDAEVT